MKITDHDSAIKYLYSLELFGIKLGLDNIRRLLDKLGKPEEGLKFIHVAGTNGKGSVCKMLGSVLAKAGLRAGIYTSPHLVDFEERIVINGEQIPKERVVELTQRLQKIALEIEEECEAHPTYFEITTAMAITYFHEEKVDCAILEVGMGGRFDATNVVTPLITIINDISIDHTDYLGETLDKIAYEKAGIIKESVPLIVSDQVPEVAELIKNIAEEKSSEIFSLNNEFTYELKNSDRTGVTVDVTIDEERLLSDGISKIHYEDLQIPLIGEFQAKNSAIATACLSLLNKLGHEISVNAVYEGMAAVSWPARIQVMQDDPVVILDSSHNQKSIRNLVEAVRKNFEYENVQLVIGLVKEKDREAIVKELAGLEPRVVVVKPDTHRALEPEVLQKEFLSHNIEAIVKTDVLDGVNHAMETAGINDIVVITGSFYTAGAAMSYWDAD
jgi:dihydrofolate synthase/folylpolyglutamate synthase